MLTRLGLADLEAGYAVSQLSGHVGDRIRVTYTLRNTSRIPKPWLEVHNPTTLPGGLPGRAITLGGTCRAVVAHPRAADPPRPLPHRAAPDPDRRPVRVLRIVGDGRAGRSASSSTRGSSRCPLWRLPAANLDGSHATPERTLQTTPLATTVRPWAPGDAFNRIHWKSTARHGDIQVKEFDLEQTADAWIILDLERGDPGRARRGIDRRGRGPRGGVVADKALVENRAVGMTVNARPDRAPPADRGGRQHLKVMQLLAAVEGDCGTPLAEALVASSGGSGAG